MFTHEQKKKKKARPGLITALDIKTQGKTTAKWLYRFMHSY